MLNFIRKHPQLLLFGILTAMFSGPGQTFLVALFIPHMRESLGLSQTGISGIYSAATLLSGFLLPFLGYLLDRVHLLRFTIVSGVLLAAGCLVLSQVSSWWMLLIGFFLIRNLGQGGLALVSSTTMARVFGPMRGKALGIANIGYPLSEAIFPFVISSWILAYGWRSGWIFLAGLMLLFFSPAVFILLSKNPQEETRRKIEKANGVEKKVSEALHAVEHWSVRQVLRDWRFYTLIIPALIPPCYLTGLFFHQAALVQSKGWSIQLVSVAFIFYALFRGPLSFMIGPVIDRFTAKKLFPLALIPFSLGLLCFLLGKHPFWIFPYLGFAGAGIGLGMTIASALWAELYGTRYLGSIRGLLTSLMVFSTAASPICLGILLDASVSVDSILIGMSIMNLFAIGLASFVCYHK